MSTPYYTRDGIYYPRESGSSKRTKNYVTYEIPEKDSGEIPQPPPGESGDWDLQYCKWSGWTWVRKSDQKVTNIEPPNSREVPPQPYIRREEIEEVDEEKRSSICGCCFKKKKPKKRTSRIYYERQRPPKPTAMTQIPSQPNIYDSGKSLQKSRSERDCCCCCCNQVCCCMQPVCCCCCLQEPQKHCEPKNCETQTAGKKNCDCQTQTVREVREQATKTSEVRIPKEPVKKQCMCRRKVCCRCVRPPCCPCMQVICCPCCKGDSNQNNVKEKEHKDSRENSFSKERASRENSFSKERASRENSFSKEKEVTLNDQLINYYLESRSNKPKTETFDLKSPNFSTLQKSLDILLKNNINIANLFGKKEFEPVSCYSSNHTIASLTGITTDKPQNRDPEHTKLLTAVCDAILSSHKFDRDKNSVVTSPRSVHKFLQSKKSDLFSSKSYLEKILSDLNFPTLMTNENAVKEIGVQVDRNSPRSLNLNTQPKRSVTRLVKNKSRILNNARFPKRVEALRKYVDLLKLRNLDVKSARRNVGNRKKSDCVNRKSNFMTSDVNVDIFQRDASKSNKSKIPVSVSKPLQMKKEQSRLDNIEDLLNSIDYLDTSSSECKASNNSETKFNQNQDSGHQLAGSAPFTDFDILLNLNDAKSESNEK